MESWGLALWLIDMVAKFKGFFDDDVYARLLESGQCLAQMMSIMKTAGTNLTRAEHQAMLDAWQRHMILIKPFQIYLPKSHAILHMIQRAFYLGNPMTYAVFQDESLNKDLKACSRKCHQATFEYSGMAKFSEWLSNWNKRRRAV